MKKLKNALLLSLILLSMFAFSGTITPVKAEIGVHKITASYYMAYIYNDHDTVGAGEWYFRLYASGSWTDKGPEYSRNGEGWVNFVDVNKIWYITASTSFQCQAREDDGWPMYWDDDATSTLPVNVPLYPGAPGINMWHDYSKRVGDVTHYCTYLIENKNPTVNPISGPSSGSAGVAYTFTTTGSDPDWDSITYEWRVNNAIQLATGSSLTYTFSTAGTYTVLVRTKDYFGYYSPYSSKTVSITSPSIITITKVGTDKKIYKVGENIVISAWIKKDNNPYTGPAGTVYARIYALGSTGKPNYPITPYGSSIVMTLVDAASGKWQCTYGPIPGSEDTWGFEGTYVVMAVVEYAPPITRSVLCFVAYNRVQSSVAKFVSAQSPSRVSVGNNFDVSAVIKNPSSTSQTFTVKLVLPSGMTLMTGLQTQDITLAAGASKTLTWTLKSTTTTSKLVKINILQGGSIIAKLHWYIRDP